VVIEPGHTLGDVYSFTTTGESTYEVAPTREAATFTHVSTSGELVSLRADIADAHSPTLKGKLKPAGASTERSSPSKRVNSFISCTSSEQRSLRTTAVKAQIYADNAPPPSASFDASIALKI
jgi:hypothetical protein